MKPQKWYTYLAHALESKSHKCCIFQLIRKCLTISYQFYQSCRLYRLHLSNSYIWYIYLGKGAITTVNSQFFHRFHVFMWWLRHKTQCLFDVSIYDQNYCASWDYLKAATIETWMLTGELWCALLKALQWATVVIITTVQASSCSTHLDISTPTYATSPLWLKHYLYTTV